MYCDRSCRTVSDKRDRVCIIAGSAREPEGAYFRRKHTPRRLHVSGGSYDSRFGEKETESSKTHTAAWRALSLAAIFSKAAGGTLARDRRNVILPRTDGAIRGNAD